MVGADHVAARERLTRAVLVVIVAGCLISFLGFGVRSSFGLFLEPMTSARGWNRETFALAMAIQNLLWGAGVPLAGMFSDRFGPPYVLAGGALIYAGGVLGMGLADSSVALQLTCGVLTGLGIAFTSFSIALAAMAKVVPARRRTLALGLGTAAGSFGQVVFSPVAQGMISGLGWQDALLFLAIAASVILPIALILPGEDAAAGRKAMEQTIGQALKEAVGHRGFVLLTVGFFVCGFHVAFIGVHFPAYVRDLGLAPEVGAYSMAIIGLVNILGAFSAGLVGQRMSKRTALSFIYLLRALAITGLLLAPKTELTIYLFSASMGLLWLSTVPLTSAIVAQVFGVRYMATLFGIVFFSHQLGSFSGVWLGGYLYDTIGTYDPVWWAGIALGLLAAVIHAPIDEAPVARLAAEPS
ncbi:MAG: MFS transporter [Gammaproteobacteria bacterium]|nr:MFS transporter [Gammaproteobacteria bacterium]